jgi:hypothetical protein
MDQQRRDVVLPGFAFVVLFVAGGLLLGEYFGGFADSDAFFVAYFADDSHHPRDLAGTHVFVASALALLLFFVHLTRVLRALGGSDSDLQAAHASGLAAAMLLLTGAAAIATVPLAQIFGRLTGDVPMTSPAVALAPQMGYVLVYFPAMWCVALAIGLMTRSGWRSGIWPRGLRWLGVAGAALLPLSWVGTPLIGLLPIWVLGVSIWAWRSSADTLGTPR